MQMLKWYFYIGLYWFFVVKMNKKKKNERDRATTATKKMENIFFFESSTRKNERTTQQKKNKIKYKKLEMANWKRDIVTVATMENAEYPLRDCIIFFYFFFLLSFFLYQSISIYFLFNCVWWVCHLTSPLEIIFVYFLFFSLWMFVFLISFCTSRLGHIVLGLVKRMNNIIWKCLLFSSHSFRND